MLKKQYKVFESEALTPSEKAQIVKIEAKEFVYSYKNIEKVSELISDKNHKFILRKLNDEIVFYCIYVLLVDEIEIYKIWVDPNERRSGLACETLALTLFEQNVKQIVAEVQEENTVARKFYKKIGFEEIRIRNNYYYDGSNCVTLIKKIIY